MAFAAAASGAPAPEPEQSWAAAGSPASAPVNAASTRAGFEHALERMAQQLLEERRSEHRWRVFFRLCWLGLALAVLWLAFSQRFTPAAPSTPHTALVELRGEIGADTEANAEALVGALKSAFEDTSAQAVVLRINSPGGSPVQSGIVNDEIHRLKAKHGKKLYAVVEEMCASGAYYIAVAADEASLELIVHLLRRPSPARILTALAFREGQVPAALLAALEAATREGSLSELRLAPLSAFT